MLISVELRWFWPDECPHDVSRWFNETGKAPGGGEVRIDRYYHSKGNTELGIKVRDDRQGVVQDLEIKGLVARPALQGLPCEHAEIWCKWKGPPLESSLVFTTEKIRLMRKFDANGNTPSEIALGKDEKPLLNRDLPAVGCNVELTEIKVRDRTGSWWSLCFEAFGDLETAPVALVKVIRAMKPLPNLSGLVLSYPAWLDRL